MMSTEDYWEMIYFLALGLGRSESDLKKMRELAPLANQYIPSRPYAYSTAKAFEAFDRSIFSMVSIRHPHSDLLAQLLTGAPKESDPISRQWVGPSLQCSVRHSSLVSLELLRPFANDDELFNTLLEAVVQEKLDVIKHLSQYVSPNRRDSVALAVAAEMGNMEVLHWLLPHCDPKAQDSEALRRAVSAGKHDVIDLLFEVSDPHPVAIKIPRQTQSNFQGHHYFWDKYNALIQSQAITEALHDGQLSGDQQEPITSLRSAPKKM